VTVDEVGRNSLFGSLADDSRAVTLTAAGA